MRSDANNRGVDIPQNVFCPRGDFLYLIHDSVGCRLKIGRARSPRHRVKEIQKQVGRDLVILTSIPKYGYAEKYVHNRFIHLSLGYEWFCYDQSIIDYFTTLSA